MVTGLAAGEVVSVQGDQGSFVYTLTAPAATPTPTATPVTCVDPLTCNPVSSIPAFWRCNVEGCTDPDWPGSVVSWPSWAAYSANARTGNQSRTVYSDQGEALYPYMGPWADGCQVTVVSGTVAIIEWKRGTDVWRETFLTAGQTHTIALVGTEDGALIEGPSTPAFSVSLANCTPQNIPTVGSAEAETVVDGNQDNGAAGNNQRLFLPFVTP